MEGWRQGRLGERGTTQAKRRDAVGRPRWRSSLPGDSGATFLGGKLGEQKKKGKDRNGLTLTGLLMEGLVRQKDGRIVKGLVG